MSTATVTPEVVTGTPKSMPVNLTPAAITKVKEIMATGPDSRRAADWRGGRRLLGLPVLHVV